MAREIHQNLFKIFNRIGYMIFRIDKEGLQIQYGHFVSHLSDIQGLNLGLVRSWSLLVMKMNGCARLPTFHIKVQKYKYTKVKSN